MNYLVAETDEYKVADTGLARVVMGPQYNMIFRRYTQRHGEMVPSGELLRWGRTQEEDPDFCPIGPEIADIEISSGGCPGISGKNGQPVACRYCYKDNRPGAPVQNMSFETYKQVFDKIAGTGSLTQVALGLTGVKDNPDLLKIMRYTRDSGCFPNFTLTGADLDYDMAVDMAELCGALAVSCSATNPDLCFDTVKLFTDLGVEQTNIHVVVSAETIPFVYWLLEQQKTDPRLKGLQSIVCLMVKPKGRAKGKFHPPVQDHYEELVHSALKQRSPIGFDSCSANRFMTAVGTADFLTDEEKQSLYMNSDPCESLCFSIYVNVDGHIYPCSFCEGEEGFEPINLLEAEDFLSDVWMSSVAKNFRSRLLERKRSCPAFPEIDECLTKTS